MSSTNQENIFPLPKTLGGMLAVPIPRRAVRGLSRNGFYKYHLFADGEIGIRKVPVLSGDSANSWYTFNLLAGGHR